MVIRPASQADLPGIVSIYNEVIATSTAVYAIDPVPLEERRAWSDGRNALGYPVLVASEGTEILGFSSFGDWRGAWPGYRYTVEHSVHVRADRRGVGVGRQLVEGLFPLARALGKHIMIGGIDADNVSSLRFHEKLGFEPVGRFREVGHKFGRWLDLIFVQRHLDAPGAQRPEFQPS
jgi:L-amino acid N-acyltransferase YncA